MIKNSICAENQHKRESSTLTYRERPYMSYLRFCWQYRS